MNLYLANGFLDMERIIEKGYPFTFIVGARGTGKTYGALRYALQSHRRFIYMRRTKSQTDIINKPDFSPFKSISRDLQTEVICKPISTYNSGFYLTEGDEVLPTPIGYTAALSTIAKMRGFDASDVDLLLYDEFIPENHERPIKDEAIAFFNAYETINRNRELGGERPLQAICMSNSNVLANPYFLELQLVTRAERMSEKGIEYYTDDHRGICIIILNNSPISEKKSHTALYRALSGGSYSSMALYNKFADLEEAHTKARPLIEFTPVVKIGELCIYKHKSKREYYASTHCTGKPVEYGTTDTDKVRFKRKYPYLWHAFLNEHMDFENYIAYALFHKVYE